MGSIIVALPKLEEAKKIGNILYRQGIRPDAICTNGADILREVSSRDSGAVICASKFPDMTYLELNEYLSDYFEMILLSRNAELSDYTPGIVRLILPFKTSDLVSTTEMVVTQVDRKLRRDRGEVKKRSTKEQEEIKQAKQLLMDRNEMSEPEAYRYIQKCSMDSGTNMVETAQMILMLGNER